MFQNDTWFLRRPLNKQNLTALLEVANSFIREFGDDVEEQGRVIDPVVWAQESFKIAQDIVYPHVQRSNRVDEYYSKLTCNTLRRQVVKGGYRLANFIKDIYSHANVKKSKS